MTGSPSALPDKSELKLNDSFKERLLIENKSALEDNFIDSSMGDDSSNKNLVEKINKQLMA